MLPYVASTRFIVFVFIAVLIFTGRIIGVARCVAPIRQSFDVGDRIGVAEAALGLGRLFEPGTSEVLWRGGFFVVDGRGRWHVFVGARGQLGRALPIVVGGAEIAVEHATEVERAIEGIGGERVEGFGSV